MNKFQQGFTLIELMIVVAILGILAAIALPMYQDYISKSQMTRVVNESADLKTAIDAHLAEHPDLTSVTAKDGTPAASVTDKAVALGFTASNLIKSSVDPMIADATFDTTKLGVPDVEDKTKGAVDVKAKLGNNANSATTDAVITLSRSEAGVWTCKVTPPAGAGWKDKFIPSGCSKA